MEKKAGVVFHRHIQQTNEIFEIKFSVLKLRNTVLSSISWELYLKGSLE